MSRIAPRTLGPALGRLSQELAPATPLARIQEAWPQAAGPAIAAACRPAAEHDGLLTVVCEAAVWAQELELMSDELVARLNAATGGDTVRALRCRTA